MKKNGLLKRIVIYGSPGSGKTTLAENIMEITKIVAYSLDDIFHEKNWTHMSRIEFKKRVEQLVNQETWIIDGNYSRVRSITLKKATLVLITDIHPYLILWRVILRTIARRFPILGIKCTPLPEKVVESDAKENLIEALKEFIPKAITFRKGRLDIILKDINCFMTYEHKKIVFLRSQTEIRRFLEIITLNSNIS